ncbi:hypothetical protein L1987_10628 [Smallanthus sonchifolius]|uniref:Uncharacterized protein n=1 Tax=Smallanthus sonchifolius TaxID=185202 RepID=A0ACB9JSS0_9ASTR|nr:hypothetical protein L1987_10628 [Smallanthus sonchifolius]
MFPSGQAHLDTSYGSNEKPITITCEEIFEDGYSNNMDADYYQFFRGRFGELGKKSITKSILLLLKFETMLLLSHIAVGKEINNKKYSPVLEILVRLLLLLALSNDNIAVWKEINNKKYSHVLEV